MPNFIAISLRGAFPQICEILRFCDFFVVLSCPVLSSPVLVILFFSQLRPGRTPGWNLTIYGGRSLLESMRNAITRLQINRLGRNFGGRIPSCSQYWKCYNSYYYGTDWDDSWMVASKQHLCCKTVSLVFGRYC